MSFEQAVLLSAIAGATIFLGLPVGRLRNRALDWALNRIIFRDVNAYANAMRRRIGVPTTRQGIYETSLSDLML